MIVPLNEYDFLKRALAVYGDCEAIVSGDLRLTYNQFGGRVNRCLLYTSPSPRDS